MNVQRLAGLGAFGAAAGIGLLFALFVWQTLPGPGTGMDRTHAMVSWISSKDCTFTTGFCFDISGGRATY